MNMWPFNRKTNSKPQNFKYIPIEPLPPLEQSPDEEMIIIYMAGQEKIVKVIKGKELRYPSTGFITKSNEPFNYTYAPLHLVDIYGNREVDCPLFSVALNSIISIELKRSTQG